MRPGNRGHDLQPWHLLTRSTRTRSGWRASPSRTAPGEVVTYTSVTGNCKKYLASDVRHFRNLKDRALTVLLAHADIAHVLYEQELRELRGSDARRFDEQDRARH